MAKFSGRVGYNNSTESAPGVFIDTPTERPYTGDVLRNTKQWQTADKVNDDLTVSHRISIIADDFALSNFAKMRYVIWNGEYWKIASVENQRPRFILTLGAVYDGPRSTIPTP